MTPPTLAQALRQLEIAAASFRLSADTSTALERLVGQF
jgi:hypothetical protein